MSTQPKTPDLNDIIPSNAPEPPDNVILRHEAWAKMWAEDNNVIFTTVGETGDGKSYATLRMAEVIDPDFTVDQVAFNIIDFLRLVMDESLGRGSVIVLEEGSVEASAMDWHSASNEVFRKVLDTWRHQNRMAIITLPSFMALEKGARRRTTGIVEMQEAREWKGYSQAKFKQSRHNSINDNFTTPFPILEGKKRKWIRFKKPSKELRDAYEEKKAEYTQDLNEELLERLLEEQGEADDDGLSSPQDIGEDILDAGVEEFIKDNNGQRYLDRTKVKNEYGIGEAKSKQVKTYVLDEGDLDVM